MVIIKDVKVFTREDESQFCMLVLEGDLEMVKSAKSGKFYATKRICSIPSTMDEATSKSLIGEKIPGKIIKVDSEAYNYEVPSTGEVIELTYSYEFDPNAETNEEVIQNEMVS